MINPDYNMTDQLCIKPIDDKIHLSIHTNTPTCLHFDVTHLSLTTAVVALHISRSLDARREIYRYQNNLHGNTYHNKHIWYCFFGNISIRCKHNHNKPYRYRRRDGGWHTPSIVTHATVWRRKLSLYTSGLTKQYQTKIFRFKGHCRTIFQDKRGFTISLTIENIYFSTKMMNDDKNTFLLLSWANLLYHHLVCLFKIE